MEKFEETVVPAHTIPAKFVPEEKRKKHIGTFCDICKEKIVIYGYDADETEIRMKEGNNFPEGGMGTETTYDVCIKCFKEKLMPFFEKCGARPTIREWDW